MVSVCVFWAASTRALYEKKLKKLQDSSAQTSQHRINGTGDAGLYSDSEEEVEKEEDEDKDSGREQQWQANNRWVA